MADENPVPETLQTIAAKIDALSNRVDHQIAETRSQLGVKIEAVHAEVKVVYDVVIAQQKHNERNEAEHEAFLKRIEGHDVRILAIEKRE